MLNIKVIKGLTDLRANPAAICRLAKEEGPVYIFNRNRPICVIMDVEDYERMNNMLSKAPPEFLAHHKQLLKKLHLH